MHVGLVLGGEESLQRFNAELLVGRLAGVGKAECWCILEGDAPLREADCESGLSATDLGTVEVQALSQHGDSQGLDLLGGGFVVLRLLRGGAGALGTSL
jgi:hypothetical protein